MPFPYTPYAGDPYGVQDLAPGGALLPGGLPNLNPLAGRGPQNPATMPLDPQTEDSLLNRVTGGVQSGLGFVAGSVDKAFGGRAIRGLLGGHPEELASLIPFSDMAGLTNPANRVSGEDLLKQVGLLDGDGEKGTFEPRDLAGPALEALLDPGTYLTFGGAALTDAGRTAKMAGTLEPTLAGRIASGQGGLVGLGLPFADPATVLGTGQGAQAAAQSLGSGYDKLMGTGPMRTLSALFDKRVEGTTSPVLQPALRAMNDALPAQKAVPMEALADQFMQLQKGGALTPENMDLMRAIHEGTASALPGTTMADVNEQQKALMEQRRAAELAAGVNVPTGDNYFPRQMTVDQGDLLNPRGGVQPGSPFNPHQIAREDYLDNSGVIGATAGINSLVKDAGARALYNPENNLALEDMIRRNYQPGLSGQGWTAADEDLHRGLNAAQAAGLDLSPDEAAQLATLNAQHAQSQGLGNLVGKVSPRYADEGLNFFGNNPLTDLSQRLTRGVESEARANAVTGALAKAATAGGKPGDVAVTDVMDKLGLTPQARANLADQMGLTRPEDVLHATIPAEVADQMTHYIQSFSSPEATGRLMQAIDSVTNLVRTGLSTLWPSRYARDFTQGAFMNWVHGMGNPAEFVQAYKDAIELTRRGGVLADANKIPGLEGFTAEEASDQLKKEMFARGIAGPNKFTPAAETMGGAHAAAREFAGPGAPQPSLTDILKGSVDFSGLDLGAMGQDVKKNLLTGNTLGQLPPVRAGNQMSELIDDANRGSIYLAKRRQGYTADAAAQVANAAQYDYGNLTGFEKSVMRRAVPFYNFMRQNGPAVLQQIAERPGGIMAASVKGTDALRHDQGYVPGFIGEGLAIPTGSEDNGQQRYLSHFGLPFEDAFADLGTGPHAVQRTLQNLLGETNPFIKAPIELASGKQLMSGRDLGDLYGSTGNSVLDQLIYNGPLSRAVTTGRTLLDERKGLGAKALNTLSPLRLYDADLDQLRQTEGRKAVEDVMQGNPSVRSFERLYVPPDQAGNLSPSDLALMRLYNTLESQAKKKPAR